MSAYTDDDLLALSGIQHFAFCPRQWALIHLERQWDENLRTMEGKVLHERVHDSDFFEARGDVLTARSVPSHPVRVRGLKLQAGTRKTPRPGRTPCGCEDIIPIQTYLSINSVFMINLRLGF